ncbi:unnamed protein product [Symbiodinium sp. CCMP2592]|nr:unnamed protein product [Symbiodinium sp. CCMP2592]
MASLRSRLLGALPSELRGAPRPRLLSTAPSAPPLWWRQGRRRTVHHSYAEVELLSRLAVLLLPREPIGELFRDFPVKKSEVWGKPWLCPDISAFGVLKVEEAALFIEYDGCFRHSEPQGQQRDERKTAALLRYAPPGSQVLRIGHVHQDLSRAENVTHAVVDVWRAGHEPSLMKVVQQTVRALLQRFELFLQQDVCERLSRNDVAEPKQDFLKATTFASEALLTKAVESKKMNLYAFMEAELQFTSTRLEALARKFPRVWGVNLESHLKPTVAWLEDVGLSRDQVAKVVARAPQALTCSIQANLKPTMAWLEDVGLNRQQVAKVVARYPQVLGGSIDGKLKLVVAWLEGVGLCGKHVIKVLVRYPQVLGCSIEANLKPTVAWLGDIGLSRQQVAKAVARSPPVLGLSIGANLKPTVAWLQHIGLSRKQVAKIIAGYPQVLSHSIENNLLPKHVLLRRSFASEQICSMIEYLPPLLGLSITRLPLNPQKKPPGEDGDLELIFSRFGPIKSCEIVRDWKTGDSLQYAFIIFENPRDCEQAYFKMHDCVIDDRRIFVNFSQSVAKLWNKWRTGSRMTKEDVKGGAEHKGGGRGKGKGKGKGKDKGNDQAGAVLLLNTL